MNESKVLHDDLVAVASAYVDINKYLGDRLHRGPSYERMGDAIDALSVSLHEITWEYVETLREENRQQKTNEQIATTPGKDIEHSFS